ncbi:Na(+)/H(+) antiporter subunit F1 [Abyssicoccus albus]|nr:Na(+)/H(+) antiporter subunit F1 [Abyssicoccus albus]AQL57096.1 Na(+)/H(+) antiporter subunit F [Abyssicoccus albus]
MFIKIILLTSLIIVCISMIGIIYRLIVGPTVHDRVVGLDALGITLMAIIALISMVLDTKYFLVVILLIGILAFIGTISFAKFLEKGVIIEHERSNSEHRD